MKKVGGPVSAPEMLRHVEAKFDDAARALKYSGVSLVFLIVEKDGQPSHLAIVKPAGLGLDESALIAVQNYRFKPATQGGLPVRVEAKIEVNFQLF